jgi:predicted CoA-binding protein
MSDWTANLLEDDQRIHGLLTGSRRIAVIGIKPESQGHKPAHSVPRFLKEQGYEIVPVPVYYPDVTEILGERVYRSLADIPGDIDIVSVFRRSEDVAGHVADILAKQPKAVWLQLGIRNDAVARQLAEAGIKVVQDRCAKIERRRLSHQ